MTTTDDRVREFFDKLTDPGDLGQLRFNIERLARDCYQDGLSDGALGELVTVHEIHHLRAAACRRMEEEMRQDATTYQKRADEADFMATKIAERLALHRAAKAKPPADR